MEIKAFQVTPHLDDQYSFCMIPISHDPTGRVSLEYAKEVLENLWDSCDLENIDISVKINVIEIDPEDIEE